MSEAVAKAPELPEHIRQEVARQYEEARRQYDSVVIDVPPREPVVVPRLAHEKMLQAARTRRMPDGSLVEKPAAQIIEHRRPIDDVLAEVRAILEADPDADINIRARRPPRTNAPEKTYDRIDLLILVRAIEAPLYWEEQNVDKAEKERRARMRQKPHLHRALAIIETADKLRAALKAEGKAKASRQQMVEAILANPVLKRDPTITSFAKAGSERPTREGLLDALKTAEEEARKGRG